MNINCMNEVAEVKGVSVAATEVEERTEFQVNESFEPRDPFLKIAKKLYISGNASQQSDVLELVGLYWSAQQVFCEQLSDYKDREAEYLFNAEQQEQRIKQLTQ
ncbi:MAG: hypothetical protein Q4D41_02330 [Prevotellaceae bacterium]|nr:hypothetical protein [Prevotellaceae bacterium]